MNALFGHIADGRGHSSTMLCCMTGNERAMVAMVETNVPSMTDKFLNNSWRNADTMIDFVDSNERAVWIAIRNIYAAAIDAKGGCR